MTTMTTVQVSPEARAKALRRAILGGGKVTVELTAGQQRALRRAEERKQNRADRTVTGR